jgi:hypothetical protein
MGSINYTLVSRPWDSTRITDSGWISNLYIFDLIISLTSSYLQIFDLVFQLMFMIICLQGVLMNKPDNSDGSRGQLTAETDTCHLLQIQSPWTWIRDTGQTHTSRAHPCAYTRQHRMDPGVLPSWQVMTFELHCDNVARESHIAVKFWLKIFGF